MRLWRVSCPTALFAQTPSEWVDARMGWLCGVKIPDHRDRRLLRAHDEWPRSRRAAEKSDELSPFLTSSARASSVDGTSRPSVLGSVMSA
jgi:hypothetical protein